MRKNALAMSIDKINGKYQIWPGYGVIRHLMVF